MKDTSPASGKAASSGNMSTWAVSAIGIGSMVGAGIFALLGQAILMAGGQVVGSFAIGGVIAILAGYSYARMSATFPSSGGITEFFRQGFGSGVTSGALSLLYAATLIVAAAMIAKSFGHYAAGMADFSRGSQFWINTYASLALVGLGWLNTRGACGVGKVEGLLVGVKIVILAVLIVAGIVLLTREPSSAEFTPPAGSSSLLATVGLIFFAYAGFGMMANCSGSVKSPGKQIPWAIYQAIIIVAIIYISLSLIVMKTVSIQDLTLYSDTAVAQASRPVLGNAGFVLVSIAAIIATLSAINATFFSLRGLLQGLASQGAIPAPLMRDLPLRFCGSWRWSDIAAIAACLILANGFHLDAVANVASSTFLISYLAVHAAHWKLADQTGGKRWLIAIGLVSMLVVLYEFLKSLWSTSFGQLVSVPALVAAAWVLELLWRRRCGTRAAAPGQKPPQP